MKIKIVEQEENDDLKWHQCYGTVQKIKYHKESKLVVSWKESMLFQVFTFDVIISFGLNKLQVPAYHNDYE